MTQIEMCEAIKVLLSEIEALNSDNALHKAEIIKLGDSIKFLDRENVVIQAKLHNLEKINKSFDL